MTFSLVVLIKDPQDSPGWGSPGKEALASGQQHPDFRIC